VTLATGGSGLQIFTVPVAPFMAAWTFLVPPIVGIRDVAFVPLADAIARQRVSNLLEPCRRGPGSASARGAAGDPGVCHSGRVPLEPGDELRVVALGDPGARATFQVGAGGRPIPMIETAPGVYLGTLPISSARELSGRRVEASDAGDRAADIRAITQSIADAMSATILETPSRGEALPFIHSCYRETTNVTTASSATMT
jgi:hypothetical protein